MCQALLIKGPNMEDKYILFEQVTDMDKNKKNIAWHIAMCHLFNMQPDERAMLCYNALPLCDQLDIDRQASIICSLKKAHSQEHRRKLLIECIKFLLPWLFMLAVLVFVVTAFKQYPYPEDPVSTSAASIISPCSSTVDEDIISVIGTANKIVRDYNKDGMVNCIDHAVAFKSVWDQMFSVYPTYKCEIVRNYNKGIMNHLFVRVKYGLSPWIYVEPAYIPSEHISYEMWDVWGSRYDPLYNIYGETNMWLARCRK